LPIENLGWESDMRRVGFRLPSPPVAEAGLLNSGWCGATEVAPIPGLNRAQSIAKKESAL
jgi:hypothetical protein